MKQIIFLLFILGSAACSQLGYEVLLEDKYGMEHTCFEWINVGGLDVLTCKGPDDIVRNVYLINGELTY
jgi:hypothetical protein